MEILRELETTPRDTYCGAIGWIEPSGRMRFNVAIRTIALFPDGEAIYNVGGGIVFDSTAEEEYDECLLKARYATGTVPASN
jgi:para-aminobenzoate synthetase component 1